MQHILALLTNFYQLAIWDANQYLLKRERKKAFEAFNNSISAEKVTDRRPGNASSQEILALEQGNLGA